jgi:hypothetical protein
MSSNSLKRQFEQTLYVNKKRKSNECIAIPQDEFDDDQDTILSESSSEDSSLSTWFKENSEKLYEFLNEELDEKFVGELENNNDIFINDIEENIESIVSDAMTGNSDFHSENEILNLLSKIITNAISLVDDFDDEGAKEVSDTDIKTVAQKTLEMINSKVEEILNNNFF